MAEAPLNLMFRVVLELSALLGLGYWGWTQHDGAARWLLGIGLPVAAATIWAVFRIPGDPGDAPVPVPGPLRLAIEVAYFAGATWAVAAAGQPTAAIALGLAAIVHYAVSYDRVRWMLTGSGPWRPAGQSKGGR